MKLTLERIEELRRQIASPVPCDVEDAELLALVDCARALARLEAWIGLHESATAYYCVDSFGVHVDTQDGDKTVGEGQAEAIAAAINAALDKAEGETK